MRLVVSMSSVQCKAIVQSPIYSTVKCMSKKCPPSIMGFVICKTKHCCVNVRFSITKCNVINSLVMTFFQLEVLLPTIFHSIPLL